MVPFITLSHVRDTIFVIITVISRVFRIQKKFWGPKIPLKVGSYIKMASIVTCYAEKYETVVETCNSLYKSAEHTQEKLGITVKNIIICICDGQSKGAENTAPLSELFKNLMTDTQKPFVRFFFH